MSMPESAVQEPRSPLLERLTATILVLVLLAVGWMVLGACEPVWVAWVPLAVQAWTVILLLAAALILVSVVALRHTR